MKTQKTIQSLTRVLGTCALFLILSTAAWAASPVIFYSDLTVGPKTGGQNNLGVFVTIWGNNFGTSQGSSYITVGGGTVNNYPTWTNTMICFQLGPNAASGNIVLVTSNGNATGPSFTVQAGNIYFVQPGASTNGNGTYASPFNHLWYAEQKVVPGDAVYVLAGTIYDEVDGYQNWHSMLLPETAGTQASPISWVAYPNATVILKADGGTTTWTAGSLGGTDQVQYIFRDDIWGWQTVSKFSMVLVKGASTTPNAAFNTDGTDGWKIVGNNITGTYYNYGLVTIGANYDQVLGNEIHDSGSGFPAQENEEHSIYWGGGGNPVTIAWNYLHGNINTGWEISCFHAGNGSELTRVGTIHDNIIIAGSGGYSNVKGILLGDVDSGEDQTTVEGQNIGVYNNVLYNLGYSGWGGAIQAVSGTAYIYNNTISQSPENKGTIQFPAGGIGPGGGHPVWYVANNVIYNSISGSLYLSDGSGNAPTWANFALLTNNNYYGAGNGPSQDPHPINANPQFVANGTNFQLQATSPDINAGYNTTSIVAQDFNGLIRSGTPSIGAYEYTGASSFPPVVAITNPVNGNSVSVGSNVSITATASETNGTITNISIYNGSTLLGSSSTSPYTYVMTNPAIGTYTLTAVATDANGVSTTSSAVIVIVLSVALPSPPVVSITSPSNGSSFTAGSNVTVTTTASETNGTISNISLYNGSGLLLGSSSSSPFNFVDTNMAAGGYSFYAVATDVNGVSTTSSTVAITVTTASAPVVAIASPTNGTNFVQGSMFTITANASESNGTISQVQYYSGSYLLATTSTPPYTASWTNATTGTFTLNAKAIDANGVSTMSSSITVTVTATASPVAPSFTAQPVSATVTAPATATFTVAATGTPAPTYQWMQSTGGAFSNISGATGSSYTTAATTVANSGTQFKCVVTNAAGSVTSNIATLTVNPALAAPSFIAQPVSATVTAPAMATFSVSATGTPAPTYQWMQNLGGGFTNINGATSSSYTTSATTVANSGTQFECVITNASGSVTSNAATLTVNPTPAAPSFTAQPVNATVTAPAMATFSVSATGTPAPTYQWMQSTGGAFTNISGATASSYTTTATTVANNGTQFKCVITNASGSVSSNTATLTVNPAPVAPSFTAQPVSATVTAPAAAMFSVSAAGTPAPTYQWMQSTGGAFTNINGATNSSYTTAATSTANNGTQFECVITNASGSVTSNAATLTVNAAPSVPTVSLTSPSSNASFSFPTSIFLSANASEANGTIAQVQFFNGSTLLYTATNSPYSFTWTANFMLPGSYNLTAQATDSRGVVVTSAPVTIIVTPPSRFKQNPSGLSVAITSPANGSNVNPGSNINIAANASENNGNIAVVYFYNGASFLGSSSTSPYNLTWTNVPAGSYTLTAKAVDANGTSVSSNPVTVTVATVGPSLPVAVITNPANGTTLTAGSNFNITASASEVNGTIAQVQFYNGSTLLGTDTTSPYNLTLTNVSAGTYTLTVKAMDINGASTTSNAVTVTVVTPSLPVVALTSPVNGNSFTTGSNVTMTANASELNGTIAQVQFYNGSTLLKTDTTSPYNYTWSNVLAGDYTLTAKVTDINGVSVTSSPVTVTVTALPPVISITGPANGNNLTAGSNLNITANASEVNGTIAQVQFFNGSTLLGTDTASPYNFTWTNVPAGNYNLTAVATDANGVSTTSGAVTVKAAVSTPVVAIISPANGSNFTQGSTLTISASASETNGTIAQVQYYTGSTLLATATTSPYTASWTNVTTGTYPLIAVATDTNGVSTSSSAVIITVTTAAPTLPVVAITNIANGSNFKMGSPINISANASDANGNIMQMKIYSGNILLYTTNNSSCSYNWALALPGSYTLTAQAIDSNGNVVTSTPVAITVRLF